MGAMRKSTHTVQYRALCEQLASIRTAAGLSQRQLAAALKLPHSWVAKVETGERRIDMVEFGWFCEACGANAADEAARFFSIEMTSPRRRTASGTGRRR